MKKKIIILLSFINSFLPTEVLFAQQDPMASLYMVDKALINPAFAGSSNWAIGTLKYRQTFYAMANKPSTQTFNFHTPVQSKHIGIGFKIINDKFGFTNNVNAALQLSYHLNFLKGKLSAGLETGLYSRNWNYNKLIADQQGDQALYGTGKSVTPDMGFGMYYQRKQFYTGIAEYHLLQSKLDKKNPASSAKLYPSTFIIAGTVIDFNKYWSVEPCILVKYQSGAKPQIDLNATVFYKEKIGAGIQYRSNDAIVALVRLIVNEKIRISYAYNLTISSLSKYSAGAHELVLSYGIKLPPPPSQKIIHPRYYF